MEVEVRYRPHLPHVTVEENGSVWCIHCNRPAGTDEREECSARLASYLDELAKAAHEADFLLRGALIWEGADWGSPQSLLRSASEASNRILASMGREKEIEE